ncbi:probable glutathione S-transferase GSTU6 [Phragmites australis]|uniref:probable glutathione S-transferase GSTU6 n=1 Tax=Phragmites australis TaxID=29695 RepID=UPI002D78DE7E|nr:probable glutathione S-transferase GSTU6 [Phragmites australis]
MAGQGDELKLLGMFASPFVLRAKLALSFKGLSYEYLEEKDLHNNKSELLLKSNPVHKKVPVLIHNGKPVCESMIIVQYIDEAFAGVGPSLLPSEPHERAIARFWAAYIDEKLFISWMMVFRGKTDEEKAEGTKQSFAVAANLEGALRECSKGKPFFGGDGVGYVDVALGGFVAWVHAVEKLYGLKLFDAAKTPLLAAWLERFGALDAAKAVMPDVGKLVELAKMRQAQAAAAGGAAAAAAQGN